jgi:small conductance mechanosensitive channel
MIMATDTDLQCLHVVPPLFGAIFLLLCWYAVLAGVCTTWRGYASVKRGRPQSLSRPLQLMLIGLGFGLACTIITALFGLPVFLVSTPVTAILIFATRLQAFLANFAAGVALALLRPFDVGDIISTCCGTGTVGDIGFLSTRIDAADNSATYVENQKLLDGAIHNFSLNTCRQVELRLQIRHGIDLESVQADLRRRLANTPYVLSNPAPVIEVVQRDQQATVIAVRPYCHYDEFWKLHVAAQDVLQHLSEQLRPEAQEGVTPAGKVKTDRRNAAMSVTSR